MIKASYYRTLITPAPLPERVLDMRIMAAVTQAANEKATAFSVLIPHVDVERAKSLLLAYEFEIVAVQPAPAQEVEAARQIAVRIGGYKAEDYVEDSIRFKIPELPNRAPPGGS